MKCLMISLYSAYLTEYLGVVVLICFIQIIQSKQCNNRMNRLGYIDAANVLDSSSFP